MSNIGLSTDLVLANTSVRPGTLVLPLSTQIPGRTITIKDSTGACAISTCFISTSGGDTFEDGSTRQALTTSYGFMKVTARSGKWFIGETTQPAYYTASTINAQTTQAPAISTANMTVSSLNLVEVLSVPYLPTSIANCILWLDAADASTYTNTSGTISAWRDKALGAVTTAQKGSGPTLSSINGLPAFYFNAGANIMAINVTQSTTNRTFFMVLTSVSNDGAYIWPSGGRGWELQHYTSNTLVLSDQNVAYIQFSGTIPIGSPFIVSITYAGNANTQFNVNGTGPGTFANQSSSSSLSTDNTHFIGGSTGGFAATFRLGEMIEYNSSLTVAQVQQVEGYLAQKWGLTASLPAGHPGLTTQSYKSQRIGSTVGLSVSSSLAYWGPYLLNSGFRTAQPQVFFLKPPFNLVSSGLLARYSMNESSGSTVIDSIAGNNITIGGSPSRVSTSYGSYTGYALSIQNATQYGYITLPANMVVGAHSITSWVYFTGFASGRSSTWVGWGGGSGCKGENHAFYNNNASVTIIFGGPSCIYSLNFLDNNTATVSPQLNTWYFCVTTWDGSNTWKTYCYSPTTAYAFTFSYGMNAVSAGGVFAIGISNNLDSQFAGTGYGGYIGEVRFYNRVLTASEVSQIYSGTG